MRQFWHTISMVSAALGVAFMSLAHGSPNIPIIRKAPTPDWVSPAQIVLDDPFVAASLLFDTQILVKQDHYLLFRRHAAHVSLSQDAPLSFTVMPEKEKLTINSLQIWRDGKAINALPHVTFTTKAPAAGTNAAYTIKGHLSDLQPGDVLDWSATWHVTTPDWPGQLYHEFFTDWAVPSQHDRTRIITPLNKPLSVHLRGGAMAPLISNSQTHRTYVWVRHHIPAKRYISNMPVDQFAYGSVSVSTSQSWAEIAAWGVQQYKPSTNFDDPFSALIATRKKEPVEARITWAVRWVQDKIAYDHDRQGLSTHIARSPAETLRLKEGDCKDKALLLVSILQALGVDAAVALTDIDEGLTLPYRAPSAFAFDHAVVRITAKGYTLFIDPTRPAQGGVFPHIVTAKMGYALPLVAKANLEAMTTTQLAMPTMVISETIDFSRMKDEGAILTSISTRSKKDADAYRYMLQRETEETLTARYATYYANQYPGARPLGALTISDDRDANIIIVKERYLIPARMLTAQFLAKFPLNAEGVRWEKLYELQAERPQSFALTPNFNRQHTITLRGIGPMRSAGFSQVQPMAFENGALSLSRHIKQRSGLLQIDHRLHTFDDRLVPAQMQQAVRASDQFVNGLESTIDLSHLVTRPYAALTKQQPFTALGIAP